MPIGTPDTDVPGDASRPLFQEPPDDLGDRDWTPGALLVALGSQVIEGPGSAVTFELEGRRANFYRPHPGKEALRYRVKAVREFLEKIGVQP